jgi:hypothetical protein
MAGHYLTQNLEQCLPDAINEFNIVMVQSSIFIKDATGNFREDLKLLDELDMSTDDRKCMLAQLKVLDKQEDFRPKRGDEIYYYNESRGMWYKFKAMRY